MDIREESLGFDVTYRLDAGRERVVRMDHDPGDWLAIEDGQPVLDH
jgi:uncharacterized protein YcfJ